jgi:hypothetical protein
MTVDEAIVYGLVNFVTREWAAIEGLTMGQENGKPPTISVSVLRELESIISDAPEIARTYGTSRRREFEP